jgi:hypothetical protein
MNLSLLRSRQRSERGRAGRFGCALMSATVFVACTVFAARGAGAATLSTNGLTRVSISSYQALPPPYKPGYAVLKSTASLRSFEHALQADHVGITSHPTNGNGCSGGIQYSVVMTYSKGRRTALDAYDCGGSITGNVTGNVKKFVNYLSGLTT